jgi:hypothetical protein
LSGPDAAVGSVAVIDVLLPGTTVLGDDRVVGARIRSLGGHDEIFVAEQAAHLSDMATASALLARCTIELRLASGRTPPAPALLGSLTAGDREALLLRLRQVSFGDRLSLVVTCLDPACRQPMDLDLTVDALCCAPANGASMNHEWRDPADRQSIRFRLPTGSDLESIASVARDDPDRAATSLARLCLVDGRPDVDDALIERLDAGIARLDPQADVELSVTCPACGTTFASALDAGELLCADLNARQGDLDLAVHLLALHYHWSENDILALPIARRRRYLATLFDGLEPEARQGLG